MGSIVPARQNLLPLTLPTTMDKSQASCTGSPTQGKERYTLLGFWCARTCVLPDTQGKVASRNNGDVHTLLVMAVSFPSDFTSRPVQTEIRIRVEYHDTNRARSTHGRAISELVPLAPDVTDCDRFTYKPPPPVITAAADHRHAVATMLVCSAHTSVHPCAMRCPALWAQVIHIHRTSPSPPGLAGTSR